MRDAHRLARRHIPKRFRLSGVDFPERGRLQGATNNSDLLHCLTLSALRKTRRTIQPQPGVDECQGFQQSRTAWRLFCRNEAVLA